MKHQLSLLKPLPMPTWRQSKNPMVVDLFCGVGGFSLGFEHEGFDTILGVDFDKPALQTFARNHPNARALCGDLAATATVREIEKICQSTPVDVLLAGPPCQGFSLTGPRKLSDPRNRLYKSAIDVAEALNPTVFILENVPGMKSLYGGRVIEEIIEQIETIGYSAKAEVLLAARYGVPQMRRRLFIVAVRGKQLDVTFPEAIREESSFVTCEDALSDLPSLTDELGSEEAGYDSPPRTEYQSLMRKRARCLFNHVATRHSDVVKEVIRQVPEGGNYKDLPKGIGEHRRFNEAWTRYHGKKPSRTIDTGHRNHFHYKWDRVPTVRENARLQSFPDDFVFVGTRTQQQRQVGNAVPPLLAQSIAAHLKQVIRGRER